MTLTIHGVKADHVWFRTTGNYISASRDDIRRWQMRLLDVPTITVHGNTLDESDVVELRVALDTDAKQRAGVAS